MGDSVPAELGTERDPPPYFAGRDDELAALRKRLRRLCETGDPRSGMNNLLRERRLSPSSVQHRRVLNDVRWPAPGTA